MAQEVIVPVKVQLENLQNIAKDMRAQLGTLKVDSSGYKKLENVIIDIEKRIQSLQVMSARPFINGKQFNDANKEIIHIQDDLSKIRIEANKIKFSDLSLDGSQKAKLQEFDEELKTINDALKQVKDSAKDTFFSSEIGKAWKIDHPKDAGKSFAEITKIIEQEVAKQEGALEKAEKAQKDYRERVAAQRQLTSFIKSGHELSKENLGEKLYNQIFDKNSNFKAGGRNLLQTWLQEQFRLPPSVAEDLVKDTGKKVQEAFALANDSVEKTLKQEKNRIGANLKDEKTNTNNGKTYASNVTQATTELNASRAVKQQLSETNLQLAKTEETLGKQYDETKEAREAYTQSLTRQAVSALQNNAASTAMVGQLQSLQQELDSQQNKIQKYDQAASKLQGISNFINRYVGAYAIIRKVSTAIRNAFTNIQELDKVITSIAVVTNMSQEDLWNKVGQYTDMAQQYGVATKDVYTVSQIFYQQGLQTAQVMDLTTETLKMAKIAGMEYGAAANAMTVAVRAFKIEMSDAQSVTDAYSALAAKFAVSSAEIANAMEKTASSAASVGMSLESTSAFISVMEQTTRESAQNIGSALKSIISRYGEMKASPDKLINVDGEEVAFNKVDTALSSIGISIKDAAGQFRDFDDVIMELAAKWNTLDNNTQRYIATVMAGNRQQSRFIALVSNYDELNRAMQVASNSENASIVQVAKTMDSLETKTNQLKNAFSQLYLDLHIEAGLKNIYDILTRIITTVGKLGTFNGAIASLTNIVGFGFGAKSLFSNVSEIVRSKRDDAGLRFASTQQKIDEINAELAKPVEKDVTLNVNRASDEVLTALEAEKNILEQQTQEIQRQTEAEREKAAVIQQNNELANEREKNVNEGAQQSPVSEQDTEKINAQVSALQDLKTARELVNEAKKAGNKEAEKEARTMARTAAQQARQLGVQEAHATNGNVDELLQQKQLELDVAIDPNANQKITDELEKNKPVVSVEATTANPEKPAEDIVNASGNTQVNVQTNASNPEAPIEEVKVTTEGQSVKVNTEAAAPEKPSEEVQAATDGNPVEAPVTAKDETEPRRQVQGDFNNNPVQVPVTAGNTEEKAPGKIRAWFSDKTNQRRAIGIGSSILRMGGTALAGYGASIQDKSTDTFNGQGIERSKIVTGLGNGLSGAGTGMSLGMMTGNPLVALAGGVVGFLAGGIDAIIDGLHMSLDERLELEKKEAKEKSDAALKEQAKATDISSSIDNIKQLQKAMYNSAEDMKAYKDAMNTLGQSYPELISTYDSMGNAVINLQEAEETLISVRAQAATSALESAKAEMKVRSTQVEKWNEVSTKITEALGGLDVKKFSIDDQYTYYEMLMDNILYDIKQEDVDKLPSALRDLWNQSRGVTLEDFQILAKNSDIMKSVLPEGSASLSQYEEFVQSHPELLTNETLYSNSNYIENQLDQLLQSVASSLNLPDTITAREFFQWGGEHGSALTQSQLDIAQEILNTKMTGAKNSVAIINQGVTRSFANEKLAQSLDLSNLETEKKLKISDSGIFSSLIARGLESIEDLPEKMTASEWLTNEDTKAAADAALSKLVQQFMTEIQGIDLDKFLAGTSDLTQYLNEDDLFSAVGITDKESSLAQELALQFAQENQANRDRILNTIFPIKEDGVRDINSQLSGLNSLSTYSEQGKKQNLALNIINKFRNDNEHVPEIISSYANYFTDQLLEIDKLAQQGYTQLASNRLTALKGLSDALSNLDSSKEQQDLFSIITSTDFTNLDSLLNAQKAIEQYRAKNNITSETDGTYQALQAIQKAEESLIFNVNTLAENLSNSISEAAKNIDSILSSNNSGLDLSKALEGLESLNVGKSAEEAFNFNDVFKFDVSLGKYVYKLDGLKNVIIQTQGNLEKEYAELTKMQSLYPTNLRFNGHENQVLDTPEALFEGIKSNTWDEQTSTFFQGLVNDFTANTDKALWTFDQFYQYVMKQRANNQKAVDAVLEEYEAYVANTPHQLFSNIDWTKLALNTDYSGTQKDLLQLLAEKLDKELINSDWNTILDAYLDKYFGAEDSLEKRVTKLNITDSIAQAQVSEYQQALEDLVSYSGESPLKQATLNIIDRTSIGVKSIGKGADHVLEAANEFLTELGKQIGVGGYTLEQYNTNAKSILDRTLFKQGGSSKALLDFASGDIGADSLETLANTLQLKLTDLVDVTSGQVVGGLDQFLSYDSATSTYKIQTSFSNFVDALEARFGIIIDRTSQAYIDTLKSYNDSVITAHTQIKDNVDKEIQGIKSIKPKDWLNLTQLSSEIKKAAKTQQKIAQKRGKFTDKEVEQFIKDDAFFNEFNDSLKESGAYIEDGILKLSENVDFLGLAQTIADYTLEAGIELSDEISDFMKSILESYTSAISKGIEGGMSAAERTDLTEKAKSFNIKLTDVDFTKTAEGLQLSEEAAIRLYRAMSSVDKLQGRILFEKLSKRLVENNIQYKTTNSLLSRTYQLQNEINKLKSQKDSRDDTRLKQYQAELAVAKEIAATRLIQEDSSWNFMSESAMPASFSNALNYWGTWVSVQKDLDESAKSGKMDPTKFVTLFKHIEDLARAEGETINFLDHEIGEGGLTLDVLMDQLWAAIEYEDDGTAYLSIEKMKELGYDLSEGSAILTDGVWTAAQNFGTKNGQQLENIHNFYKELLALRRDLGELDFDDFTDDEGTFSIENLQKRNEKAYNDLMKFGEKIKANGKDFAKLMTEAGTTWKPGGTNYELIKSIFTLMSSDEWDVETGYQTIGENLIKSGFTGELDLGDVQIAVKEGKVITKADEDEDWEYNGEHFETSEAALNAMLYKDVQDIQKLQGNQDNTIKIGDTTFTIEYEEGGSLKLVSKDGKTTYSSAQEAAEKEYEKYVKTQKQSNKPVLSERAWKIEKDLEVVPTLKQQKGILTNDQLALLRQSSIEELQAEFKASPLEFAAKYNIDLRDGDVNWDDIKRQIESDATAKSVQVGITNAFSGVNGTEIGTQLGAGIAKALTDIKADVDTEDAKKKLADLKKEAEAAPKPKPISLDNNSVSAAMDAIKKINEAASAPVTKKVYVEEGSPSSAGGNVKADLGFTSSSSKFQTQLANAKGTLMGELGPEMVVSKGHYFLVGQQGPEMVDLADDAIVFNHLQTQSLLGKGFTNTRGKTITNERNAVAYATGSRHGGVAKESLADAVQRTIDTTGADIHKNGAQIARNRSSNNKNADKAAAEAIKAFIKEVDRWYNYLQEIARLERDITKEEKLRSEYQSHMTAKGKEYADSLLDTLPLLRQQAAENRLLANDQEKWLKGYVAEQADSPWARFWTIDEHGQEKYNLAGFEKLEQMVGTDKYGKPNMTPEEQMAYLKSLGVTDEWFQYDSSGNAIDTSTPEGVVTAIQSLWEHMDKTRETVQTHLDSIDEHNKAAIDNQTTINGHLKSIEDNQIAVENKVLKAIEETRQREIDAIQDEKDAIEKSSQALINGLSDQLSKEQDMYSRQQDANELSRLQRQLSILQRSGGSASQIASLQKDITERQQDAYFDAQKAQIAALQDASDNQLQKLQEQIDLMTEQLAYEKEHGMLWEQVYQVMAQSPEYIAEFIMKNTEEHWGKSPTEFAQVNRETLFQAEWFKEISDRVGGVDNLVAENDYGAVDAELDKKTAETEEANAAAKEAIQATANATSATGISESHTTGQNNQGEKQKQWYRYGFTTVDSKGEPKSQGGTIWAPNDEHARKKAESTIKANGWLDRYVGNVYKYDRGGMVEQDGPAFVHAKEGVLTAEQTSILRNEILGNKPNSALSMLSDLRELWNAAERTANIPHTNDASVIIENATVEMNVSRIANDYDAQRAGEQALDQMLAIARRTQAQNRVGR